MRRLTKTHIRTGIIILVYSLMITIIFFTIIIRFHNTATKNAEQATGTLYSLTNGDIISTVIEKSTLTVDESRIISSNNYQNQQVDEIFRYLIPYTLIFLVFLFVITIVFWTLLRRIYDQQANHLAEILDFSEDNIFVNIDNKALGKAYEKLNNKYREQLEDSKRLYSYFSHEQKNALTVLRTNLELNEQSDLSDELSDLSDSIDDVLTLTESSNNSIKGIVDVSLVCAEVCDKYKIISDNIIFKFNEDDDALIWAKERWIYRLLCNLVDNAVKYGEGKPIVVTVGSKHNSVIVSVKDNGIGISDEKQEKIFNHNYRVNELNKDGYGIGLSLVSHVCDLCCGFAMVESSPEKGTTFYISFPAAY